MRRFRVGSYASLVMDMGYVIQEKKWWGWKNRWFYDYAKNARRDAMKLKEKGYIVEFHI